MSRAVCGTAVATRSAKFFYAPPAPRRWPWDCADAPNLSPSVIARLRGEWEADYSRWQRRDLSARRYVYIWADGVYLQARMEPQAE